MHTHIHTPLCSHTLAARVADTRRGRRIRLAREFANAAHQAIRA